MLSGGAAGKNRGSVLSASCILTAFPSSALSKSSEKSSSFFFEIGSVGIEGSFGTSAPNVVAVTWQACVRKRGFKEMGNGCLSRHQSAKEGRIHSSRREPEELMNKSPEYLASCPLRSPWASRCKRPCNFRSAVRT